MRLAAIPKSALPSEMEVRVPVEGEYGGCYGEPVRVSNVRFDSAASIKPEAYTFAEGSKGLVFVDALNSRGAFQVPEGSLLAVDGEELSAVKVTPYCGYNGRVHHWEIEVR